MAALSHDHHPELRQTTLEQSTDHVDRGVHVAARLVQLGAPAVERHLVQSLRAGRAFAVEHWRRRLDELDTLHVRQCRKPQGE
jgi:hypothetical protein